MKKFLLSIASIVIVGTVGLVALMRHKRNQNTEVELET